jgi:hypothetical protein
MKIKRNHAIGARISDAAVTLARVSAQVGWQRGHLGEPVESALGSLA